MRLIDADKLVKAIENENPGLSISGAIEKFARTAQVNMQPTIDAIPIEWIKDKMDKLEDIGRLEFCEYLDELLVDWKEENEQKTSD